MTFGIDLGDGLRAAFTTPIQQAMMSNAEELNAPLASHILQVVEKRYATEPPQGQSRRSDVGGQRTDDDFLDDPAQPVAILRNVLRKKLSQMIAAGLGKDPESEDIPQPRRIFGWANVNRAGDYNVMHNHPKCHWSAVYYVSVPPRSGTGGPDGSIEFEDPRGAASFAPFPGFDFGGRIRIIPTAGQLIIFPSWLQHTVHPFSGEGVRISVAVNAQYDV